jgi:hypothetical protein
MTDQPPGSPPGWQQQPQPGYPHTAYPAQQAPNPKGPRVWRNGLLVGLVIGLVIGAGALGLAWALSGSDGGEGAAADAEAVCGIVERTPPLTEDTPSEDMRRLAVAEVAVSMAKQDHKYQPLADTLEQAVQSWQQFEFDEVERSMAKAKQLCDEL